MAKRKQDTAERQRKFRESQKRLGLAEVRGAWAPPHLHDKVREYARKLAEKASSTRQAVFGTAP
jgi:hypothetical protein